MLDYNTINDYYPNPVNNLSTNSIKYDKNFLDDKIKQSPNIYKSGKVTYRRITLG